MMCTCVSLFSTYLSVYNKFSSSLLPLQLRQHKATVAAAQRELRRRQLERMSPEELREYRTRVATAQRELRARHRASMTDEQVGGALACSLKAQVGEERLF